MENNASKQQYASFGARFLAYWVDLLIFFPLGIIIQSMLGNDPFAVFQAQTIADMQKLQHSSNQLLGTLIAFAFGLAYYLIFWVNYDGATPGKKLLGIKIVRDNGEKLTYPTAFIRYIGFILSGLTLVFLFGLGYLWVIWDKKKQALHDKFAGTVVIKTGQPPKTALAVFLTILAMLLFFGYIGATLLQGISLGMKGFAGDYRPAQSLNASKQSMSPQAKVHYDKTQELFKQMRDLGNNVTAIKPIADENIREAKMAVDAQPDNVLLWSNLGDAYGWPNTIGTQNDSLNAYKKAEELDPSNVVVSNAVGDELIRLNRNEDAIIQFQKSLRLSDNSAYAHISMGTAYKNLGIYNEARTHLERGIEIFKSENTNGSYDTVILQAQKELSSLPAQ